MSSSLTPNFEPVGIWAAITWKYLSHVFLTVWIFIWHLIVLAKFIIWIKNTQRISHWYHCDYLCNSPFLYHRSPGLRQVIKHADLGKALSLPCILSKAIYARHTKQHLTSYNCLLYMNINEALTALYHQQAQGWPGKVRHVFFIICLWTYMSSIKVCVHETMFYQIGSDY